MGTERSAGTKVFALGGKINNTGLVEVPMGTPLRTVIYDIGGGIPHGRKFKAVQTGGPSGGCIPASLLDVPIEYDSLIEIGSMMGSGGMIVMDEDNCMVDIARFFLDFTVDNGGKCTPCRIGTRRMLEIRPHRGRQGRGRRHEKLNAWPTRLRTHRCAAWARQPNRCCPRAISGMSMKRISRVPLPAHHCTSLLQYQINDKCRGCTACSRKCPVGAISGEVRQQHHIDQSKCIKCGACLEACRFDAIIKV